ncbi:protein TIFY 11e-like [Miscanthus floridulus]|uniref:protein TIFY 11e-like n=1 Tax=Miscanthus floridulus TaxID=154761 RepID=UPI00345994AE
MAPSPMAEAGCSSGRRRFAVACSVLSQCVRAETAAAHSRPAVQQQAASASPMLLMPGADVVSDETVPTPTPAPAPAPASAKLTIVYGGRVLVFDDVRADRAAEVMRVAARQDMPGGLADHLQVARKATLQRVMEKRRDRLRTREPYAPAHAPAATAAVPKEQREKDADKWLRLGIPG